MHRLLLTGMMLVALLAAPAGALATTTPQPADPRALHTSSRPVAVAGVDHPSSSSATARPVSPRALAESSGLGFSGADLAVIVAGGVTLLLFGAASRRLPGPLA